jgi:hypothetical protein
MRILSLVACGDVSLGKFFLLGLLDPEDGGTTFLQSVQINSPSDMASHPRRLYPKTVPL